MSRRFASFVTTAVTGVLLATIPAAPAAAAVAVTAFTVDRTNPVTVNSTELGHFPSATVAPTTTPANGLRFTSGSTSVAVAPPAGQPFAVGSFPVASTQTDTVGYTSAWMYCPSGNRSGTVTVDAVTSDGAGQVTSLSGSYDTHCVESPEYQVAGVLRYATADPYVATTVPATETWLGGIGVPSTRTVTVNSVGTGPAAFGTATIDGANAADFAITGNTCSGTSVAPAASCTLDVTFSPTALGGRSAKLAIPATGHPRAAGQVVYLRGTAYAPPQTPRGLTAVDTADGPGLAWQPNSGDVSVTGYTLHRRADAGAEWADVATVPHNQLPMAYVDTALATGDTAEYAVSAVGHGGRSALSAAMTVTRPASTPVPGAGKAIVIDSAGVPAPVHYAAGIGVTVSQSTSGHSTAPWSTTFMGERTTGAWAIVKVPVVRTGTYTVAASPAADQISMVFGQSNFSCQLAGTLTVRAAVYASTMAATTFDASFAGTCDGSTTPVHIEVRWASDNPYVFTTTDRAQIAVSQRIGSAAPDETVTVTSVGSAAATMGTPTIDGPAAADWSVVSTTCDGPLAPAAQCAVVVRFTPSVLGTRNATLHIPDGTSRGERTVSLNGVGGDVPAAPQSLRATGTLAGVGLVWGATADNNIPLTGYRVYRSIGESEPTLLANVPLGVGLQYVDRTAAANVPYRYFVAGVNGAGEGARTQVDASRSRAQLVETYASGVYVAGLYVTSPTGGDRIALEVDSTDHYTPAVSPDGKSVAYARSDTSTGQYDIWVRATDGTGVARRLTNTPDDETDPAWSPDGKTIAYEVWTNGETPQVFTVPAAGGARTLRGTDIGTPAWLSDNVSLVVSDYASGSGALVVLAPNGARRAIAGTSYGYLPRVSPDGRRVAFLRYDPELDGTGIAVSPVDGSAPAVAVTPVSQYFSVSWRADGAALYVEGMTTIATVPYPPTGASPVTVDDGWEPAYDALGVQITSRPALTTSAASLTFGIADAPAGATYTCARDGDAAVPCTSPWTATGLVAGVHSLVVTATVGDETTVAAHTWTVDTTVPTVTWGTTASVVVGTTGGVSWNASDSGSGVASYDVRYRRASFAGAYGAPTYPGSWQHITARSVSSALAAGYEYCYSVRARDKAGNTSGWTAERCLSRALDDRSASAATGWSRLSSSAFYNGTYTQATRTGTYLAIRNVSTKRITLVATKCSTCGSVTVYIGSVAVGSVNLYASRTARKVQIALPVMRYLRTGTVTIKTTSAKTVQIDGVAFRRT